MINSDIWPGVLSGCRTINPLILIFYLLFLLVASMKCIWDQNQIFYLSVNQDLFPPCFSLKTLIFDSFLHPCPMIRETQKSKKRAALLEHTLNGGVGRTYIYICIYVYMQHLSKSSQWGENTLCKVWRQIFGLTWSEFLYLTLIRGQTWSTHRPLQSSLQCLWAGF